MVPNFCLLLLQSMILIHNPIHPLIFYLFACMFALERMNYDLVPARADRQLSHLGSASLLWLSDLALGLQIAEFAISWAKRRVSRKREGRHKSNTTASSVCEEGAPLASLRANPAAPRWWLWLPVSVEMRKRSQGEAVRCVGSPDPARLHLNLCAKLNNTKNWFV